METQKSHAVLTSAVATSQSSESSANTFHGLGQKGNVRLKVNGTKRTGCGFLYARSAQSDQDSGHKSPGAIVHTTPGASPLNVDQIIQCIDEETEKEYLFVGTFVKKSNVSLAQPSAPSTTAPQIDSSRAGYAASTLDLKGPKSTVHDTTSNERPEADTNVCPPTVDQSSQIAPQSDKQEKTAHKLKAELDRVSAARNSGCDIRIKRPVVEALLGISRSKIYRDKEKDMFPKPQPKMANSRGVFWLLSDIDLFLSTLK